MKQGLCRYMACLFMRFVPVVTFVYVSYPSIRMLRLVQLSVSRANRKDNNIMDITQ